MTRRSAREESELLSLGANPTRERRQRMVTERLTMWFANRVERELTPSEVARLRALRNSSVQSESAAEVL